MVALFLSDYLIWDGISRVGWGEGENRLTLYTKLKVNNIFVSSPNEFY